MDYQAICEKVCAIAHEAGAFIAAQREGFSFDKVEFKGTHDMVSYVDKEAERIVVKGLSALLPEAGFVTEEGTVAQASGQRYRWIIDPLDGTTNFIHGVAPYCVSLALTDGDEPVVGVVYEVVKGECFYAWKGSAAYLDGRPIRVAATTELKHGLYAVGLSHASQDTVDQLLKNIDYFLRNTSGVRRIGSAAADLVYVAAGRFDGFYQKNLSPWDVAAGALIVERAGGRVTDFSGGSNYVFGGEIISTPPAIYDEFKRVVLA